MNLALATIECEEFYSTTIKKGAPFLGEENKICPLCGGSLETVKIYFEEGVTEKICSSCNTEQFIDVTI